MPVEKLQLYRFVERTRIVVVYKRKIYKTRKFTGKRRRGRGEGARSLSVYF